MGKMFEMVKAIYDESAVLCTAVKYTHCRFRERRELFKDEVKSQASDNKNGRKHGSSSSCSEGGLSGLVIR